MAKKRRPNPVEKLPPTAIVPKSFGPMPPCPDCSQAAKVYIVPRLARLWMEWNRKNRPDSLREVDALTLDMERDQFHGLNGETIKFSRDEQGEVRLDDGQGRLQAIINSKKPQWSWVIWDINTAPEAFDMIDIGRKRTLGQMLARRGHKHYNHLAAAVGVVYKLDCQLLPGGLTPPRGLAILDERPEIEESLTFVAGLNIQRVWSLGYAAGLHCLMARRDAELADVFFQGLADPAAIRNKRSPALAARDWLLRNRGANSKDRASPLFSQAIVIKAWNRCRAGRTVTILRWTPEREDFPEIE